MPALILINGPPAVGTSALARRHVEGHPLALHLDLDGVRTSLGRWPDHHESQLLAGGQLHPEREIDDEGAVADRIAEACGRLQAVARARPRTRTLDAAAGADRTVRVLERLVRPPV